MDLNPRPEVTVVVASHDAAAVIGSCLDALTAQPHASTMEIVVADSSVDDTPNIVRTFSGVRLLHFDEPLTLPELRGRGIAVASGRIIAIIDPFAIVDVEWSRVLLDAHRRCPNAVIAGAVDLYDAASQPYAAWAIYINEYGMFMPPVRRGAVSIVPGCNVSYKREALFAGDAARFPVFWKTFVNDAIARGGSPLWLEPDLKVSLLKPVPFGDFLFSRFDHGRCYAAMRRTAWSRRRRLVHAILAPALPIVLLWRWASVYWQKQRNRARLVTTLPVQVLLFGVWAVGEAWGYLRGSGRSCRRLFY